MNGFTKLKAFRTLCIVCENTHKKSSQNKSLTAFKVVSCIMQPQVNCCEFYYKIKSVLKVNSFFVYNCLPKLFLKLSKVST